MESSEWAQLGWLKVSFEAMGKVKLPEAKSATGVAGNDTAVVPGLKSPQSLGLDSSLCDWL